MPTLFELYGIDDAADQPPAPKPDTSSNLVRGGKEAFQQLPQLGYGMLAGAGAALENMAGEGGIATGIKKAGIEGYSRWGDKIAAGSKPTDSWDYSWDRASSQGNFGALVDWLAHGIGYVGAQGVQMLAGAGIGTLAGKATLGAVAESLASGMVRKQAGELAAEAAAKDLGEGATAEAIAARAAQLATTPELQKEAVTAAAAKIGQTSAVGANAFGMEGGEIFGDLTQGADKEGRTPTGAELGKAFAATLAAGGLEFVGDKLGLDVILGKSKIASGLMGGAQYTPGLKGRIARGGIAAGLEAPVEGGTEYGQTLIEEAGKGNDPFGDDAFKQAREAGMLGVLGGTVMGGIGGAIHGAKPRPTAADVLAEPTIDDAARTAMLAIEGPARGEPAAWEVVDDRTPLLGAPRQGGMLSLPAPTSQVLMADAAGSIAPQPAEARTAAQQRAFEAQQQAEAQARADADLGLTPGTRKAGQQRMVRDADGNLIPVGEATELPLIPTGDAQEVEPVPAGEASELLPTADATELPSIPVGDATDIDFETIQPGDLMARDGEPYSAITSAQARAFASKGGLVVKIPDYFGDSKPGYVVRPITEARPNGTRGTNAGDVVRPAEQGAQAEPSRPVEAAQGANNGDQEQRQGQGRRQALLTPEAGAAEVAPPASPAARSVIQHTAQQLSNAWESLSPTFRADILKTSAPALLTPAGRTSDEAKRLARLEWTALDAALREKARPLVALWLPLVPNATPHQIWAGQLPETRPLGKARQRWLVKAGWPENSVKTQRALNAPFSEFSDAEQVAIAAAMAADFSPSASRPLEDAPTSVAATSNLPSPVASPAMPAPADRIKQALNPGQSAQAAAPVVPVGNRGDSKAPAKPKVFKTRKAAEIAKATAGNTTRIKAVKGGFILRDATEAEMAAAAAASARQHKRFGSGGGPGILAQIARLGGMDRKSASRDAGVHPNDFARPSGVFGHPIFRANGGMSAEDMKQALIEDRYLPEGATLRDLEDAIGTELGGRLVLPLDHDYGADLEAQQAEAERQAEESLSDFTPDDLESSGYSAASPEVQALTEQAIAEADGLGIDTESLRERVAMQTEGASDAEYHAAVQAEVNRAIAEARADAARRDAGTGRASNEDRGEPAGDQGRASASEDLTPDEAEYTLAGRTWRIIRTRHSDGDITWRAEVSLSGEFVRVAGDKVPLPVAKKANAFVKAAKEAAAPAEPDLLSMQSEDDLRAKAEREEAARKADADEQRRLANAEAKRVRDLENAEKDRRAAAILAERERAKKAEVDAAADSFDLGQEPPAPVDRKVSTAQAAGQRSVFDAPAEQPKAPQSFDLMRDGIAGREIPWGSAPNGSDAFQYAIGKTDEDGRESIYRRRADERGTYGGWRWEAKAPATTAAQQAEQPAAPKPIEAWQTSIPTQGLPVQAGDGTVDGSRRVVERIAKDAADAVTQNQKLNSQTLYAYLLPSTEDRHAIVRLFPDDQVPPKPWKLMTPEALRVGFMSPAQIAAKVASSTSGMPTLAYGTGHPTANLPDGVVSRVRSAVQSLKTIDNELAQVQRYGGPVELANRLRDRSAGIEVSQKTLAEFRKLAKKNGTDAAALIAELGGEPDFKKYSAKAEPAAPATQAAAILDAAAEPPKGKERLDVLKDVKAGAVTPEEVQAAYPAKGGASLEYPLAPAGTRYEETDKPITMMTPDAYLAAVRPLAIDEASRDNIDDLKAHILAGKTLDPLHIRADGKEDGRHRAVAAKELGIKQVPVVDERAAESAGDFPPPPPMKPGMAGLEQVARIYIDRGMDSGAFAIGLRGAYNGSHEYGNNGRSLNVAKLVPDLEAAGFRNPGALPKFYESLGGKKAADATLTEDAAPTGPAPMPAVGGISMSLAQQAHSGTSFSPERRAVQERDSFNSALKDAWDRAARIAGTDQAAIDRITEVFADVADGYRSRHMAALGARSRVMSTMITGGSNFPVRRNEKRNETARKRSEEASQYLDRGIKRLIRAARGPIDNSPESELERVRLNLSQREEAQEQMKAANVALRKGDDEALRDLGFTDEQIAELKKPDFAGRTGFPDYKLTNNNAEIRRLRERLKSAEARVQDAAAGPVETERPGVRIVEDATDDRLRLIFDGKPSEDVRNDLKAAGFKWSPSAGAWQRQLTGNARQAANSVLDKHFPPTREDDAGNVAMFSRDEYADPSPSEAQQVERGLEGKTLQEAGRWLADNAPPELAVIAERAHSKIATMERRGTRFNLFIPRAGEHVPAGLYNARGVAIAQIAKKDGEGTISVWLNGPSVTGKVGTSFQTAIHELVHAATMAATTMGRQPEARGTSLAQHVADLDAVTQAIHDHIRQRFADSNVGKTTLTDFEKSSLVGTKTNALRDQNEVLAWALTSPGAQAYLEGIKYKGRSLWSAFVQAVRSLLGLKPSSDTALSEVLRISDELFNVEDDGLTGFPTLDGGSTKTQQAIGRQVTSINDGDGVEARSNLSYRGDDGAMFSRRAKKDVAQAWKLLSEDDDVFTYPKSDSKSLDGIIKDSGASVAIEREPGTVGDDVDGAWRIYPRDPDGKADKSKTGHVIQYKDGRVELNVDRFTEGDSGSAAYAAVGNYAFNNNLKFAPDRFGLSQAGIERRLENVISLALKFGTTDFISLSSNQLKAFKMKWRDGDTTFNLEQMLSASFNALAEKLPEIKGYTHDFITGKTQSVVGGMALDDAGRASLIARARAAGARVGERTIARAVFTNTFASAEDGKARRRLLGEVLKRDGGALGNDALSGILYSQQSAAGPAITEQSARAKIADTFGPKSARALLDSGLIQFVTGRDFNGATLSDGRVLLNLDSLTEDTFGGVLQHEAFHAAAREWVGPQAYDALMTRMESLRKMAGASSSLGAWFERANAAIPADTRPEHLNGELAAYAIEQNAAQQPKGIAKWVRDFLSALRVAIIKHMPNNRLKVWATMNVQPEDLARMAVAAMRARGEAIGGRSFAGDAMAGAGTMFQRVWHGSPHRFEKFSTDHIGSGEGAQAYGHGLYFTSRKDIAEYYRKKLAGDGSRTFTKDGKTLDTTGDLMEAYYQPGRIVRGYGGADKVLEFKRDGNFGWTVKVVGVKANGEPMQFERPRWHSTQPDANNLRDVLEGDGWEASKPGQLYEAEIPEDSEMLLWDKPLSEQPAAVREALNTSRWQEFAYRKDGTPRNIKGEDLYRAIGEELGKGVEESDNGAPRGWGSVVNTINDKASNEKAASEALAALGIKGIKYLDGTSRNAGDGSYNYVVFSGDDAAIQATMYSRTDQTQMYLADLNDRLDALEIPLTSAGYSIREDDAGFVFEDYRSGIEYRIENGKVVDADGEEMEPESAAAAIAMGRLAEARDAARFGSDIRYSRASQIADRLRNLGGGTTVVGSTRQYTPEQRASFKNVGREVTAPTLEERAKALWTDAGKKLAQGLVDQFAPVKDIDSKAYGLLRLAKGASGAFEALLNGGKLKLTDGAYNFDDTQRGGVIDSLLRPLQGEHHDFMWWVAANRAERLAGEGRERLFSPEDIAALKTLADGTTAWDYTIQHGANAGQTTRDRTLIYADSLKTFNAFQKNVLDMTEQSGGVSAESRAAFEQEFYVPFYRVDEQEGGDGILGATIKGGAVRQQFIKQLKGGKEKLNADLLDNTLMNWAHLLDAAAKNRAAKATLDAAERMGKAVSAPESAARDMASAMGKKNNVVWVMDDGTKHFYIVEDRMLLTAISSLEYAGMRSPMMKALGAFKHALTIGVTFSPFFKVRNLIRDSLQAIGTAPISANPLGNVAQGWKLTDPKSDAYFRLLAGGGTIHFGTMIEGSDGKRVQALVEMGVNPDHILDSDRKYMAFYRNYVEKWITAYNELGNRGEAVNRASLYAQLRAQGTDHAEASLQARDLMDFSMQGSFTTIRFLAQVVPFLNARIQGLYKLGRAAKEDPARFSAVIGATALSGLALMLAYHDDEDWKKREDWDRNNWWWFKIGGTAFRIPKPFEVGAIASLAERGFELAFDKEMTGTRFRQNVLALLGDNLSMNPIPQLVKPMLDVYANKDSFTGRPIETAGMERLRPDYRFNSNTSMTARGVSTAMNAATNPLGIDGLSPVQVDQLVRGYFGWLGTFVVQVGDILARPATGQPERPSSDMVKVATGGMASDLRDAPSRYVSQMYQQATLIEQAYGTWRELLKEGKTEEASDFKADHQDALAKYRLAERSKQVETKLNQETRRIEQSQTMSAEEKRARIRDILAQKDRVARPMSLAP